MKKIILASAILGFLFCLSACNRDRHTVKVGTVAGPETELMEVAVEQANREYNTNFEIVTFNGYVEPNIALNDGEIQANMFQHAPYLEEQIAEHGYQLEVMGKTFVYPMGLYSTKVDSLADLPTGAMVAIPNDPTNEGRALLLLQNAGLISLAPGAGLKGLPKDVVNNPKQLVFKELDAASIVRAYQDVGLAAINTNFAIPAGLYPSKDALFVESKDSPYANVVVVQQGNVHELWAKLLVKSLHSQKVLEKAQALFEGEAIPAWED